MKELEQRILADGKVLPGDILKVDGFLNHQMDMELLDHIGQEFCRLYHDEGITKILTVEASGIAVACMTAYRFRVPAIFAKKNRSLNIADDVYHSMVHSYTHQLDYPVVLSSQYLGPDETVLIVDDFLANGQAVNGLLAICEQAGCKVAGVGICIEKGFQPGGEALRRKGIRVESLAVIESMEDGIIRFREQK